MQEVEAKIDVREARSLVGKIRLGEKLRQVVQAVRRGNVFRLRNVLTNRLREIFDFASVGSSTQRQHPFLDIRPNAIALLLLFETSAGIFAG